MKIRIETDENLKENEVVIRCRSIDEEVLAVEKAVMQSNANAGIIFYKENYEYYFPVNNILFFETSQGWVDAHTENNIFKVKYKLYELEQILPHDFIRISKSAIVNIKRIYSLERNITSAACIKFTNTHKQIFASRNYYKNLKKRLEERRMCNE